jgi:hypothetical protein
VDISDLEEAVVLIATRKLASYVDARVACLAIRGTLGVEVDAGREVLPRRPRELEREIVTPRSSRGGDGEVRQRACDRQLGVGRVVEALLASSDVLRNSLNIATKLDGAAAASAGVASAQVEAAIAAAKTFWSLPLIPRQDLSNRANKGRRLRRPSRLALSG